MEARRLWSLLSIRDHEADIKLIQAALDAAEQRGREQHHEHGICHRCEEEKDLAKKDGHMVGFQDGRSFGEKDHHKLQCFLCDQNKKAAWDSGLAEARSETKCHNPATCPGCAALVEKGRQEGMDRITQIGEVTFDESLAKAKAEGREEKRVEFEARVQKLSDRGDGKYPEDGTSALDAWVKGVQFAQNKLLEFLAPPTPAIPAVPEWVENVASDIYELVKEEATKCTYAWPGIIKVSQAIAKHAPSAPQPDAEKLAWDVGQLLDPGLKLPFTIAELRAAIKKALGEKR